MNPSTSTHDLRHSTGLYRSRNNWFLGICQGIADWRMISVIWVRLIVLLLTVITGFWPVFISYLILGLILKPEPAIAPSNLDEKEFYDSYAHSRSQALNRLKNVFDQLDRRTQRIENIVTSSEYEWDQKLGHK